MPSSDIINSDAKVEVALEGAFHGMHTNCNIITNDDDDDSRCDDGSAQHFTGPINANSHRSSQVGCCADAVAFKVLFEIG